MPIPPRIKFDYSTILSFEVNGYDREALVEGVYSLDRHGEDLQIETSESASDIPDCEWEQLDEYLAEQSGSDYAEWLADRDDYLDGVAQDRELERHAA